ncbi:MAG: hypothetical protein H6713_25375 [Myxococcales bacterium]|nr:hypothetical protein [Myxococcales bacterium]MCB9753301.1 hypothetical protein [Myxococcales bacterium]
MHRARASLLVVAPLALLLGLIGGAAGCDKPASSSSGACTASSIGACASEHAERCGIQMSCTDQIPRELRCTPPDTALPMACECIEAGASKQKVQLDAPLGNDLAEAGGLASARCGWTLQVE